MKGPRRIRLTNRQAKTMEKLLHKVYTIAFVESKMRSEGKTYDELVKEERTLDDLWTVVMFLIETGYGSVGEGILPGSSKRHEERIGVKEG